MPEYWFFFIIFPIGVLLFFSLLQFIFDAMHKPYLERANQGEESVTVFLYSRGRAYGSYGKFLFVRNGNRWKYKINKGSAITWLITYVVVLVCLVIINRMDDGISLEFTIDIIIAATEAIITMSVFFPVWAYFYLKKNV